VWRVRVYRVYWVGRVAAYRCSTLDDRDPARLIRPKCGMPPTPPTPCMAAHSRTRCTPALNLSLGGRRGAAGLGQAGAAGAAERERRGGRVPGGLQLHGAVGVGSVVARLPPPPPRPRLACVCVCLCVGARARECAPPHTVVLGLPPRPVRTRGPSAGAACCRECVRRSACSGEPRAAQCVHARMCVRACVSTPRFECGWVQGKKGRSNA
jgi:hypothetical protein